MIKALTEASLFRLLKVQEFGGYEQDLQTFLAFSEVLGQAGGSAAWLIGFSAAGTWLTAHACTHGQEEIFSADLDARLVTSIQLS